MVGYSKGQNDETGNSGVVWAISVQFWDGKHVCTSIAELSGSPPMQLALCQAMGVVSGDMRQEATIVDHKKCANR